jgi:glycosyltransferase involved in cell wall biosynthesis
MPDRSSLPRIGFNAALLSFTRDYRATGVHHYIAALLAALSDEGAAITAYVGDRRAAEVLPPALTLRPLPRWAARRSGRILWEQLLLPPALRRDGAALLHSPAYAMPLACPAPAVVTVHDLSFFHLPETFPRVQGAYLRRATRRAARHAAALIAVSDFTRRELERLLGADPARVFVVPNGIQPGCRPLPPEAVAAFSARSGLPEQFVLTLGTLQPRKNVATLLRAYAELTRRMGDRLPALVIAGAPGWGRSDLPALIEALGLRERVILAGYVPPEDLPALYNAALLLAYPSRYEGFGLPVVEAMACGTPVVLADATSLPEVGGEAALRVPPEDVAGWAAAMATVLADPARAADLRAAGLRQATRYSWSRAAQETLAVYRQVLAGTAGRAMQREVSRGPA